MVISFFNLPCRFRVFGCLSCWYWKEDHVFCNLVIPCYVNVCSCILFLCIISVAVTDVNPREQQQPVISFTMKFVTWSVVLLLRSVFVFFHTDREGTNYSKFTCFLLCHKILWTVTVKWMRHLLLLFHKERGRDTKCDRETQKQRERARARARGYQVYLKISTSKNNNYVV